MRRDSCENEGSLRVWFRDEIRNALVAAYATSCAMASHDRSAESITFRKGFTAALIAIGLNFGIAPLPFAADDQQLAANDAILCPRQITEGDSA